MTGISTGTLLAPVFGQGQEESSYNILFDTNSTSTTSHTLQVDDKAFVVQAYGLGVGQAVELWMVTGIGGNTISNKVFVAGTQVKLTSTNTVMTLDLSGRYQFRLTGGGLGDVHVVGFDIAVRPQHMGLGS